MHHASLHFFAVATRLQREIREIKSQVFAKRRKREVVPHDQVFPLIVVNCLLFLLKN